mgnify:CR=1 FL=1
MFKKFSLCINVRPIPFQSVLFEPLFIPCEIWIQFLQGGMEGREIVKEAVPSARLDSIVGHLIPIFELNQRRIRLMQEEKKGGYLFDVQLICYLIENRSNFSDVGLLGNAS